MKIITVDKPIFKWNDEPYVIQTQMLKSDNPFNEIQNEINKQTENGMTHCFIYNLTNAPAESTRDASAELLDGIMVRWCFVKLDNSDLTLGKNVRKIEKMLRGEA